MWASTYFYVILVISKIRPSPLCTTDNRYAYCPAVAVFSYNLVPRDGIAVWIPHYFSERFIFISDIFLDDYAQIFVAKSALADTTTLYWLSVSDEDSFSHSTIT